MNRKQPYYIKQWLPLFEEKVMALIPDSEITLDEYVDNVRRIEGWIFRLFLRKETPERTARIVLRTFNFYKSIGRLG